MSQDAWVDKLVASFATRAEGPLRFPVDHRLDLSEEDVHVPTTTKAKAKKKPKQELPEAQPATGKKARRLRVIADIANGGALHVRHMSDVQLDGVDVHLDDGDGSSAVWIQIAKPGTFRGHPAGPFELNDQVFSDIIRNFRDTQNRAIPIDFEHASEADSTEGSIPVDGAPAQGWIRDLKVDGANLWGLVEWGTKAREYIRAGQYKFFSPAIRFGARDRVSGKPIGARMTSGALTNNPFLDGMRPLVAKDMPLDELRRYADENPGCSLDDAICALEMDDEDVETDGVDMDDNEDEGVDMRDRARHAAMLNLNIAGVARRQEIVMGENATDKDKVPTDEVTTLLTGAHEKISKLTTTMADRDAKIVSLDGEIATLKAEIAKRDEIELAREVDEVIAVYKDSRGLSDKQKPALLSLIKADAKSFRDLYPKVAPEQRHLQRNLTDHRERQAPQLHAIDGGKDSAESVQGATKRLMKEKNLSYVDAQNLAFKLRAAR